MKLVMTLKSSVRSSSSSSSSIKEGNHSRQDTLVLIWLEMIQTVRDSANLKELDALLTLGDTARSVDQKQNGSRRALLDHLGRSPGPSGDRGIGVDAQATLGNILNSCSELERGWLCPGLGFSVHDVLGSIQAAPAPCKLGCVDHQVAWKAPPLLKEHSPALVLHLQSRSRQGICRVSCGF